MFKNDDTPTNGRNDPDIGAENIDHVLELCGKALIDIFEECASRYERAAEAETELHNKLIAKLEASAKACRERGLESAAWLRVRGESALTVVTNTRASVEALAAEVIFSSRSQ